MDLEEFRRHGEGMFSSDPRADRFRGLPVGQPFGELQHRDQHQHSRQNRWTGHRREELPDVLGGEDLRELIPQPHRRRALRTHRPRHPRRLRRNLSQPHCRSDTLPEHNVGLHRHNQAVKADVTLSPRLSQ
ncbi:hypothetical protein G3I71_43340 [Streptomyces sp. SID12501]|uniref:Uncharacterized protein n=1 Tax=Streptomyces sp. SID12501 TaxID=2706042 RepID=A0A6B3C8J0_9ACTN|nr:hypothetical protein [Streptomyces sp. SID12501]